MEAASVGHGVICNADSTADSAVLQHPPRLARQTERIEHGLSLLRILPLPARIQPCGIPSTRQLPAGIQAHELAARQPAIFAPPYHVRFQPEGEDCGSGICDVVPEAAWRHHEVDDGITAHPPIVHG